jgi:hypothetical protein
MCYNGSEESLKVLKFTFIQVIELIKVSRGEDIPR